MTPDDIRKARRSQRNLLTAIACAALSLVLAQAFLKAAPKAAHDAAAMQGTW